MDACPRCGFVLDQPPAPVLPPVTPVTTYAAPYPAPAPRPVERRGLSTASVPKILLGLGATCLLVAAVIFLAVAWSFLGVGGRTAVLVLLTAATAAGGQLLARRDLGVAAEALTTVSLGLLVLDVVGADRAGWLGDLDGGGLVSVVGATVLVATLALVPSRLVAPQVAAPLAVGVTGLGFANLEAAVGVVLGCAALATLRRGPVLPWLALGVGLLGYAALGLGALDSALGDGTRLWLLVVAALALLPWARLPRNDDVRQLCCAFAASVLTFTAAVPVYDESLTALALAACAGVVFWSVATAFAPARWYAVPRVPLLGSLVVLVPLVGLLMATALESLVTVAAPFTASAAVRLDPVDPDVHPLVLPLGVVVVLGAAFASFIGRPMKLSAPRSMLLGLPVAALTAALYPLPLCLFVLALGPFGVLVAWPSAVLTFLSLSVTVLVAVGLLVRRRFEPVAGAVLPLALAGLVWTGGHLLDVAPEHRSLAVLGAVGLLALAVPRPELGAAAATAAVLAATQGVLPAVHLTLAGALVTATALVHRDRRVLAWPGGLLLAAATWVRLWEVGVSAPEAYTLPTALALLLVGGYGAHSSDRLLPGLLLATVPSLLWALADPVSLRAALLGLACLVLVVGGAERRWSAPLLVGAVVGGLLVLRELAPYAEQTPQWLLIGAAGTVLIGAGVTWEARVRDLRRATAYLGRLR